MPAIRPVKINFGKDAENDMWDWVEKSTKYCFGRTRKFREEKLKDYARLYKGQPVAGSRDIPWPGASNIEIQVIGSNSDNLLSRVMAMYMTDPIWTSKAFGDIPSGDFSDMSKAVEKFGNMALEPAELP